MFDSSQMKNSCYIEFMSHLCKYIIPGPRILADTRSNTFLIVASIEIKNPIAVVANSGLWCPWNSEHKANRIETNRDYCKRLLFSYTEINDSMNGSVFWIVDMATT